MEKINVANLLKDCPSGMELNCTMYEDVHFDYVDELNIVHCYIQREGYKTSVTFNQHGTPNSDVKSKCVIFLKDKTTWEGFEPPRGFKDGDVVATNDGRWIGITAGRTNQGWFPTYCVIRGDGKFEAYFDKKEFWMFDRLATEEEKRKLFDTIKANGFKWNSETKSLEELIQPIFKDGDVIYNAGIKAAAIFNKQTDMHTISHCFLNILGDLGICHYHSKFLHDWRLATEEEKQILFESIEEHGYKWNPESKTLEKLVEPKFKVGDKIVRRNSITSSWIVDSATSKYYGLKSSQGSENIGVLPVSEQDDWVLVPNKFDISTLKPFESKVLVRDVNGDNWVGAFIVIINQTNSM